MNKVFKVIWSEARNAYVVVSEMAKSHGTKSCSTKKLLAMLIATGVMTCASVAPAMAANPAPTDTKIEVGNGAKATGGDSVAIGNGAEAQAANGIAIGYESLSGDSGYGVAVGGNTQATGTHSVALGQTAKALEYEGIAIGHTSLSEGSGAIAIGKSTNAKGTASLAFGNDAKALEEASIAFGQDSKSSGNSSIAIGRQANATGQSSIAIGFQAVADKAYSVVIGANTYKGTTGNNVTGVGQQAQVLGDYSAAFGMAAQANKSFTSAIGSYAKATADNANAMGSYSTASADFSVALGTLSVADRTGGYVGLYAPDEDKDSLTWKANAGAVSVGSSVEGKEITRQITNVAAGTEDTDAVNVSQLKKVSDTANAGWNLSTNGVATGATNVKPGDYVDFSGDKNISVSHDGTKVQVKLNKNIDVNYVQTNALNSKYSLSVGTMAENGIMPFLVSSTGAFYAANNNFSVDKYGKVIATAGEIGNVVLQNGVYTGNSALRDGELYVGDASGNYSQITTTGAKLGQVTIAADGKISGVAAGAITETSTDAVNGSQLHAVKTELQTSDKHLVGNPASADGYYKPDANGDISLRVEDQNKNGYDVVIKDVASKAELGDVANRVTNVENKVTQIETDVTTIKTDITTIKTDITNINTRVDNVEALAGKHTTLEKNGTNINVEETVVDGQKNYKVNLNKDITLGDENGNNVSISGTNGTITATGDITTANRINAANGGKLADIDVTGNKLSNGNSSITLDGTNVKVNDKVTVDKDGKISGVAKGDISNTSTDAVNGSQLYDTNTHITNVENQVISNSNRINQLGNRVNKVGAGAAALAALHPMDFDPDDKLTFSAGYGNYGGENAAAIGAYYRPDEKVMFSVAGTVGNGENMVNAGVSFALDRTNHVSNSRTALAREVIDLRGQLAVMGAKMAKMEKAFGMLDETKTKLFPDVPANHWAYEYIAKLAGNGYIEGYPDGNFGGDRLMTRYEFAAMLYRAIEKGAALEEKIIKEFEPELGRIRVDRISGEDGDRDKIERVRVNDTKGERDHYGNKLAK